MWELVIFRIAFAASGATKTVFVDNKINSILYQDKLIDNLQPVVSLNTSGDRTFQKDNAFLHSLMNTKLWLKVDEVKTLQWPF